MTPDRLPWLRFYPQDFMGDGKVRMMNAAERGIYISLLCHEWSEGPIPDDPARLARLCGTDPETMEAAWPAVRPCFEETEDGRLIQPRLEEERAKALAKRKRAREAAHARWDDADAMRSHSGRSADAGSVASATGDANQSQSHKQTTTGDEDDATAVRSHQDGPSPSVKRVWSHYVERYAERYSPDRAERLKLTAAGRAGKIRGRLREGYDPDDLCRAIDGCFGDDWHRERDKHDLSYIMRNQEKVEGFISRADRNGGPEGRGRERETARERYDRNQAILAAYEPDGDDRD